MKIDVAATVLLSLCAALISGGTAHAEQATPPASAEDKPSAAPTPSFSVREFRVLGNTVLTERDIDDVLYPLLGDNKTLADVTVAKQALEKVYHDRGYQTTFVDLPPQEVAEGIIRLKVSEGHVGERKIEGARYFSEQAMLDQLPATTPGTALNLTEIQQQLTALSTQTADRAVVPVLRAGAEPGATDLDLKVSDHLPLHGSVELNNQNTPDTRPLRASVGLSYDDLFGELNSLALQYQTAPQQPSQVGVYQAAFTYHPLAYGIRPSLSFVDSTSSFTTLGTIGVLGKGQIVGGRLAIPLPSDAAFSQSLTLGVDYKHFRNAINESTSGTGLITPISYVNTSLAYAATVRSDNELFSWNGSFNFGPRGFANDAVDFEKYRYRAYANYFYLRSDASLVTTLPERFAFKLRLAGQLAFEPLISNEQDIITGADGVRGYLEGEELGDRAIKGTAQLQLPPVTRQGKQLADFYLFFDMGRASTMDALPSEAAYVILRSWGAGLDLLPIDKVSASLTLARPMVETSYIKANSLRVLFDLHGAF